MFSTTDRKEQSAAKDKAKMSFRNEEKVKTFLDKEENYCGQQTCP